MRRLPLAHAVLPPGPHPNGFRSQDLKRGNWTAERRAKASAEVLEWHRGQEAGTSRFETDVAGGTMPKVRRPRVREDCLAGGSNEQRPCPFFTCKHHLGIDIDKRGDLVIHFPDKEPWELEHTCALDLADMGGRTLEQVSETMNCTRERVRQLEGEGLDRLRHVSRIRTLEPFAEADTGAYDGLGAAADLSDHTAAPTPGKTEETDDELEDVRAGRPTYSAGRLPRFGDGDDDQAEAEADWFWEYLQRDELERAGKTHDGSALVVLNGLPLSPMTALAIDIIRQRWQEHGRGPTQLELADLLDLPHGGEANRRAAVTAIVEAVRAAGALEYSKARGYELVTPRRKEKVTDNVEARHDSMGARGLQAAAAKPGRIDDGVPMPRRLRADGSGAGRRVESGPRADVRDAPSDAGSRGGDAGEAGARRVAVDATGSSPEIERLTRIFVCPPDGPAEVVEVPAEPTPPVPAAPTPEAEPTLTPRQMQIIEMANTGASAKEMAAAVGGSPESIRTAVARLRGRGLVTVPPTRGPNRLLGEASLSPKRRRVKELWEAGSTVEDIRAQTGQSIPALRDMLREMHQIGVLTRPPPSGPPALLAAIPGRVERGERQAQILALLGDRREWSTEAIATGIGATWETTRLTLRRLRALGYTERPRNGRWQLTTGPTTTNEATEGALDMSMKMADTTKEIIDRYNRGEESPDIAKAVGKPIGTVYTAIWAARKKGLITREPSKPGPRTKPTVRPTAAKRREKPTRATKQPALSETIVDMISKARARLDEIEEEIAPLVVEKVQLEDAISRLGG